MTSLLHIEFTGTRRGMTQSQLDVVVRLVRDSGASYAHHGCCVGADQQFHIVARAAGIWIVGHPGPGWPNGPLCARVICDEVCESAPYGIRNRAIVDAASYSEENLRSHGVVIAAPYEDTPQPRGGTWSTILMALRALRAGKIKALHVVGRDGQLLDHTRWM